MKIFFALLFLASTSFAAAPKTRIALNWKPEPQFGGFYAAGAHFKNDKLDVEIIPGGAGAPVPQLVASGKVEFGVVTGDEIVVGQDHGLDLVALYASYQTFPQGIMVHKARGFKKIDDVFANSGTLALQKGVPYVLFLESKFAHKKVSVVPYIGGIAQFMKDPNFAQQCFVTSEPLSAAKSGADAQSFLIADAGYNPYTTVLVARRDFVEKNRELVHRVVSALRAGWADYLKDPTATNKQMNSLNPSMDLETFSASATAQRSLIENDATKKNGLGTMTDLRWSDLAKQLADLKVISKAQPASRYFVNP